MPKTIFQPEFSFYGYGGIQDFFKLLAKESELVLNFQKKKSERFRVNLGEIKCVNVTVAFYKFYNFLKSHAFTVHWIQMQHYVPNLVVKGM